MVALRNKYWVLRHGRSIPNERGLIVSHINNGVLAEHGLANEGIQQAEAAGQMFLMELEKYGINRVRIVSSPFSRTLQTSEAVAKSLDIMQEKPQIQVMEELRERYFGPQLELESHIHYSEIWELDANNPMVGPDGGESVADVAERALKVLLKIETELQGYGVLIVAHGDTLQILQTIVRAVCAAHRSLPEGIQTWHFESVINPSVLSKHRDFSLLTGELRRLA